MGAKGLLRSRWAQVETRGMYQPEKYGSHNQPAPWRAQRCRKPLLQEHAEEEFLDNSNFNHQPGKAERCAQSDDPHW